MEGKNVKLEGAGWFLCKDKLPVSVLQEVFGTLFPDPLSYSEGAGCSFKPSDPVRNVTAHREGVGFLL